MVCYLFPSQCINPHQLCKTPLIFLMWMIGKDRVKIQEIIKEIKWWCGMDWIRLCKCQRRIIKILWLRRWGILKVMKVRLIITLSFLMQANLVKIVDISLKNGAFNLQIEGTWVSILINDDSGLIILWIIEFDYSF